MLSGVCKHQKNVIINRKAVVNANMYHQMIRNSRYVPFCLADTHDNENLGRYICGCINYWLYVALCIAELLTCSFWFLMNLIHL